MTLSRFDELWSRRLPWRPTAAVLIIVLLLLAAGPTLATAKPTTKSSDCFVTGAATYYATRCKVARLKKRSFVVVALIDTGLDPYHEDFALPADSDMQGVPPWKYIDGFPKDTPSLSLSLGASSYNDAVAQDRAQWDAVKPETLYTFPGTKVIGGITFDELGLPGPNNYGGHILDEVSGHGTSTASLAAGMIHSLEPDTDVLIVTIQGLGSAPVQWAVKQPWIDIVSNSWGTRANVYAPLGEANYTRDWVEKQGGEFVVAAGNGVTNTTACDRALTTTSAMSGPPWHLSVGAVSGYNDQPTCWSSIPPDVSSYGNGKNAAAYQSQNDEQGFAGTSMATPIVSSEYCELLLEARRALGDSAEGPRAGAVASATAGASLPTSGPLADGTLTREELEQVVLKTALVKPFSTNDLLTDPFITPTTPEYYIYEGYGLVNRDSLDVAREVLFGQQPMPDRSDVDQWMATKKQIQYDAWDTLP